VLFSCGTLSLPGSLSKSGGGRWDFLGTVIPAAHSATNSFKLEMAKSDERGKPVHEKCYVLYLFPDPANILDYPDTMSGYERESRWADAKLAAEKAKKSRSAPRAVLA
jgi:hypothetical protein